MKHNHVMLDLETMGQGSDAAIIAIGATTFGPDGITTAKSFYETISLQSSVDAGLKMDASTVMWWMKQSDAARGEFKREGTPLGDTLLTFSNWFTTHTAEDAKVWGNGATFDNVIISNAYRAVGLPRPWKYYNDACYRTLKGLLPHVEAVKLVGTAHNALDDARHQAVHCAKLLHAVGAWK